MTSERLNFLLTIDIMIHVLELLWRKLTFSPLQHILRCFLLRKCEQICCPLPVYTRGEKKKKRKSKITSFLVTS